MKNLTIISKNILYYLTRCLITVVDGIFGITVVMAAVAVIAIVIPTTCSSFFGTFDTGIIFLVFFAVVNYWACLVVLAILTVATSTVSHMKVPFSSSSNCEFPFFFVNGDFRYNITTRKNMLPQPKNKTAAHYVCLQGDEKKKAFIMPLLM